MRVVLIGFGPFPGTLFNPSAALVKALARRRRPAFAGIQLVPHVFKTTYAAVDLQLPGLFALHPDIILMFGLAARRRHLCIETRAGNAVSVLFPDASGHRPQRAVIAPGRPAALRGTAPFADLLGALRRYPIPARLSRDAGRYLCNYAYWRVLERTCGGRPLVQFVHIPPISTKPWPRRQNEPRGSTFATLVAAGETLLIALLAASRR
ncbi:MAG TPA: pyroglutamyl-peptidase I [Xanthobacteraceae bacterium]|nr:pyroglutamyl-peptidase I [Xanthobacteraceae bacterium]